MALLVLHHAMWLVALLALDPSSRAAAQYTQNFAPVPLSDPRTNPPTLAGQPKSRQYYYRREASCPKGWMNWHTCPKWAGQQMLWRHDGPWWSAVLEPGATEKRIEHERNDQTTASNNDFNHIFLAKKEETLANYPNEPARTPRVVPGRSILTPEQTYQRMLAGHGRRWDIPL